MKIINDQLTDAWGNPIVIGKERSAFVIAYLPEVESDTDRLAPQPTIAGLVQILDRTMRGNTVRIFLHSEINEEFAGRGLVERLLGESLKATAEESRSEEFPQGLDIVAVSPLVKEYLLEHEEFVVAEGISWREAKDEERDFLSNY